MRLLLDDLATGNERRKPLPAVPAVLTADLRAEAEAMAR